MGSMSIWHWILVLAIGLLLFGGRGKISDLMGDFAKGIKSFKKGLSEDETAATEPAKVDTKTIDHQRQRQLHVQHPGRQRRIGGSPQGRLTATRRSAAMAEPANRPSA